MQNEGLAMSVGVSPAICWTEPIANYCRAACVSLYIIPRKSL